MPEYKDLKPRRRMQSGTSRWPEQPKVPRQDRQSDRGDASLRSRKTAVDFLAIFRHHPALTLVALLAVCVPLIPAPVSNRNWHGLRTGSFEAGASLLLILLLARFWTKGHRKNWAEALSTPPLRFLMAFFCWGCLSAALAPAKPFAMQGLLQVGAGALVAVTIAAEVRARPQCDFLLNALTAATLLISLSGFALYGQGAGDLAVGLYHDHMLYGAVFTILLPLMLGISLSSAPAAHRLPGAAALLCGLLALGLAETRSSWIGVAVAGTVFGVLSLWTRASAARAYPRPGNKQWRQAVLPAIVFAGGLVYFLMVMTQSGHIVARLQTLTTTGVQGKESLTVWRFQAWRGARNMILQRPLLGFGIGCYPRYQFAFTGMGHNGPVMQEQGPTIFDEAHNSYLQTAVETGLPGLFLWLGVLLSMFIHGVQVLRRLTPGGLRQCTLIGCLSALAGQAIDAIANPGWQFGEVSLFLWILLGLTVALSLGEPAVTTKDSPDLKTDPLLFVALQTCKIVLALAVGAGLLWIIFNTMAVLPAPTL